MPGPSTPDPAALRAFADLSIVNELDLVEQNPTVRDRYGDYFSRVFASWSPIASPPVIAGAGRVLDVR